MLPLKTTRQISVTGGTGHLGSSLVPLLLEEGHSLVCLYRKKPPNFEHPHLNWIKGSLNDVGPVKQFLRGSSVLIHSAGEISLGEKKQEDLFRSNVEGTLALIKECTRQKVRLIYISSSTAAADPKGDEVLSEMQGHKQSKEFYYAWTKAEAERLILNAVEHGELDAVIIRPTAFIGPPDHEPSRFGKAIYAMHRGKLRFISSGGYNLIDVRDLSRTIANSIFKGVKGEVYLAGGHFMTLSEVAMAAGSKKAPLVVPVGLLLFLLPFIRLYDKLFGLPWPVSRDSLRALKFAPKQIDCSKAKMALDHQPRPVRESIEDLIAWMEKYQNL